MNTPDAAALAKRIVTTWHGGPGLAEWTDALTDLSVVMAMAAFVKLRNTAEHPPSIATFRKEYRMLVDRATPDPPAVEDDGRRITLPEYLAILRRRAPTDPDAALLLANFTNHRGVCP